MNLLKKLSLVVFVLMILLSHIGDSIVGSSATPMGNSALMVILDASGSMSKIDRHNVSRIMKAVEATHSVFSKAEDDKIIGLRKFNSSTTLIVRPSVRGSVDVDTSLSNVTVNGSTDIGGALLAAADDITDFTASTGVHTPWTWILVSDGEGDNPTRDLNRARDIARRYPHVVCHTIGIDMSDKGAYELRQIAQIFGGQCWIVGQGELVATVEAAASLAGFKGADMGGKDTAGEKAVNIAVFGLIAGIFGLLATVLRQRVSEGKFLILLSFLAGAVAWAGCELLLPAQGASALSIIFIQNSSYFMIAGVAFGVILTAAEGIYIGEKRRAFEKGISAFHVAVFGGIFAGLMGQGIFYAISRVYFMTGIIGGLISIIARATGWSVAGAVVGACPGAASGSRKQIDNGLIGGFIGGAAGGFMFQVITFLLSDSMWPRMVALCLTAVAIAVMIRVVEEYRKEAWLIIEKGGPSGKVYIINKANTLLGSHYKCDVVVGKLKGQDARPEAKIMTDGKMYKIVPMEQGQVKVNGQVVASHHLSPGDLIEVAAGQMSFYCRRSDESQQSGPSSIEEDMILPKTSRDGGIVYEEEVQGMDSFDGGLPKTSADTSADGGSGDEEESFMEFGELEVAGRKIEKSSQ